MLEIIGMKKKKKEKRTTFCLPYGMSQDQIAPGYEDTKHVCWPSPIKSILVNFTLLPTSTATDVLSRGGSEAGLLHSWKRHLYRTSPRAEKKCYPTPSQPNFLPKWKILPLIRKLCQTTVVPDKLLSLSLLQFWQPCSAEPCCSSQLVTTLNRATSLSLTWTMKWKWTVHKQAVAVGNTAHLSSEAGILLWVRNSINNLSLKTSLSSHPPYFSLRAQTHSYLQCCIYTVHSKISQAC